MLKDKSPFRCALPADKYVLDFISKSLSSSVPTSVEGHSLTQHEIYLSDHHCLLYSIIALGTGYEFEAPIRHLVL